MSALKTNTIVCGDCIAGMAELPDGSIDVIITDPPFAIDFKARRSNYNRTAARVLDGYQEVKTADYRQFSLDWMRQAKRLLKASGSMFVFSGWNNLKDILIAADTVGLITVNHIIWKYQFGVFCRRRFVSSHYHCLFLCVNDKRRKFRLNARYGSGRTKSGGSLLYADLEDVWTIKREYWRGDKKTPTKLPRELIEKILGYVSDEGDIVLDPFLGSGQVAVVSQLMGRRYIGFEIVPDYADFVNQRLAGGSYRIR